MDEMTFDEEEEHTIVFDDIAPTSSTLAPSVPNVTPLEMEILPHSDDEQMIVFDTEMVTPVCLFPAIPCLTVTSINMPLDGKSTVALCDSDCGLGTDMIPRLLVDEESAHDNGKDVLIDVATSLGTSHDVQHVPVPCSRPIPLATLQGHYNTVHCDSHLPMVLQ